MKDYTNIFNGYFYESKYEENSLKNFFQIQSLLFNENENDEDDNSIYKAKNIYINNNLSGLVTCEFLPNNLCEIENVKIYITNNNILSAPQKTTDSNNYVLTQAELFVIPSVKFSINFNQEKILGRKKKIQLFRAKEINFQKII